MCKPVENRPAVDVLLWRIESSWLDFRNFFPSILKSWKISFVLDAFDIMTVQLEKPAAGGLGLSIVGRSFTLSFSVKFVWLRSSEAKKRNKQTFVRLFIFQHFANKLYYSLPANICLFKVNNRNIRKKCEICSKLNIRTTLFALFWCF